MANTYVLIASNTLGSSAASVTFSSIPGTYTDLVLKTSIRMASGGTSYVTLYVELNGSTAANYSNTNLRADGATPSSNRYTTTTALPYWTFTYSVAGSTATSNTFNNGEIYFPNYTSSANKVGSNFSVSENNATDAGINSGAGLWQITNAITQIKITNPTDNFATGSSFFLYGIKSS